MATTSGCPTASQVCTWQTADSPLSTAAGAGVFGRELATLTGWPVPFEEDEKDPSVWFLDHNYVESMNDMFKKINAREKLIGWYHTGPKLRASDLEVNELFKRYTPNPLLVIIDVQPKEVGVPTDAYFAVEEIKDVSDKLPPFAAALLTGYRMAQQPPRHLSTHPR